ncbi:unnamed protein product [Brachionus calyciflorus]|uniref:Coronin n=1 Tax=Brachionus calyciflorus TaxID=104777 RepID=A0A813P635_9BILA|nr:unnamed protein product [Brachionus calyciflorus]
MYKLAYSKYKNMTPLLIKKEQILTGLSTNRISNTIGSLINCSLNHITFTFDSSSGGSVCTIRHEDLPRRATFNPDSFCVTHAHSAPITDIQYNNFNQSVLATCALDSTIKLWTVSDDSESNLSKMDLLTSIPLNENRSDCIQWNPNVAGIFVSSSLNTVYLWDVNDNQVNNVQTIRAHTDTIQGLTWKRDGSLLCTTAKDKTMIIVDPRNINTNQNLKIENSKTANKDSKICWLGETNCILSSVYTQSFTREIHLWDIRNTSSPVHESTIDSGNNVLNPFYDHDTSALFLVGKAETTIKYGEVFLNDSNWSFAHNSSQALDDQIKAVCLLPKLGLDLMKCEIDRLILLTRNSVYPLPYLAPRNDKTSFHQNLYPDTYNLNKPGCDKKLWMEGQNSQTIKIPLNPNTIRNNGVSDERKTHNVPETSNSSVNFVATQSTKTESVNVANMLSSININNMSEMSESNSKTKNTHNKQDKDSSSDKENDQTKKAENVLMRSNLNPNVLSTPNKLAPLSNLDNRKSKAKSVYYQSKFKYINGKAAHKNEHITNIRSLSTMWSAESNGFQINSKHAAFFVSGNSGQIGIVELNKVGRLDDAVINTLVNRVKCSDFQWDPFDDETLAAACDDCTIKLWKIPEEGLDQSLEDPPIVLTGHADRLASIKYHPYAKNVLASSSYDKTIKIWNIDSRLPIITLHSHTDFIFSFNWSPCGSKLATICKDGYIRVYEPLKSEFPILESKCGPRKDAKAARIEWVLHGRGLLASGFGTGNLRQIFLFDSENLNELKSEDINHSPSLLIPYFDVDINVLYLYAKGEETINLYEIQEEEPYFQVLTPFKPDGSHLAIGFLPKISCDIKSAEIAKAYRLTKDNRIEPMSFTVPRVKLSFFQDDIYPDTIDRHESYLNANDWFNGIQPELIYINLQPAGMQKLSEILAVEQSTQPSKPNRNIEIARKESNGSNGTGDMYDPQNLSTDERKIISSMLQRATLFRNNDKSEDEEDNSEWD